MGEINALFMLKLLLDTELVNGKKYYEKLSAFSRLSYIKFLLGLAFFMFLCHCFSN